MKKIKIFLLIQALCILAPKSSFAQEELNVYTGINKSGLTFTNFEESGWDFKNGFFIGVENIKKIGAKLDLSTHLQFSNKGWTTPATDVSQSFKYIDLINTVSYRPVDIFSMFAGVNTGVLLNSKSTIADKNFDLGIVVGGGFHFNKFNIKLHYNTGLLTVDTNTPGLVENEIKVLNTNFQLGIGYNLYKGGKSLLKEKNPYNYYETGVKFIGLNSSFSFLYKKQLSPNKFVRIGTALTDIRYNFNDNRDNTISLNFQLAAGVEKSIPLNDNLDFFHGFQPFINLTQSSSKDLFLSCGLGYVLGAKYTFSNNIILGIEAIPSLSTFLSYNASTFNRDVPLNLFINNQSAGIFVLYGFKYEKLTPQI